MQIVSDREIGNDVIRLIITDAGEGAVNRYGISKVQLQVGGRWETIAEIPADQMFRTADE